MKEIIKGFRDAIQELLVPELKEIRTAVSRNTEAIRALQEGFAALREELAAFRKETRERFEALQKEMNQRFEAMIRDLHGVSERSAAGVALLDGKLTIALQRLDLGDRVARIESELALLRQKISA